MRTATSPQSQLGSRVAQLQVLPAPIGGLNTRDPPAMLPPTDASKLTNCYPTTTGISSRPYYLGHTTGFATSPDSLMVYTNNSGAQTLFAAANNSFYNISAEGALGAAVVSGLSNNKWESVNFTNSAGTAYLCCFNGADSPRYWDGATWTAITGISSPSITGLTTSTIVSGFIHQRRLWLVQANSLKVWYLPADSVGGAASAIDLGGVATLGGYVMAGATWTVEGGDGLNDLWMVITSQGQLIAYQGVDPSSASSWVHVGTWNIAAPFSRRCMQKFKGDLLVITEAGVVSAAMVMAGETTRAATITDKIRATYEELIFWKGSQNRPLWSMCYFAALDLLVLCPNGAFTSPVYALNAATGAWGGDWDIDAKCIAIYDNGLYYSVQGGTTVRKLTTSLTGSAISGDESDFETYINTAFTDCQAPGVNKQPSQYRIAGATVTSSGIKINTNVLLDYAEPTSVATPTNAAQSFDGVSQWFPLQSSAGVSFSLQMGATDTASGYFVFTGFHVLYQSGGIFGSSPLT